MVIDQAPFKQYRNREESGGTKEETFTVRLGKDFSRNDLDLAKKILEQERDSTAIKQLAIIGLSYVLHDEKTRALLAIVFKNKRNNKRQGIVSYDPLS